MKTKSIGSILIPTITMLERIIREASCRLVCGEESGTGFLVAKAKVLTARHCVAAALESGKPIEAIFYGSGGDEVVKGAIIAESKELDACLLEIPDVGDRTPVTLNSTLPREGSDWESFGFPLGKTIIGHRIFGKIAQLIDPPRLRIDMDLFVDPSASLEEYEGLSGAPLTSDGSGRALLRLQVDKTLGALSIHALREFLVKNGVVVSAEADSHEQKQERLAERNAFQSKIETAIQKNLGRYLFLEGAHGIGKTTFCKTFKPLDKRLINLGTYSLLPSGDHASPVYRAQPEIIFDWLHTAISKLITGKVPAKKERNYIVLIEETFKLLHEFSRYCESSKRYGVIFIDGLNEVQATDSTLLTKLLGILPMTLPSRISIVLSSPNFKGLASYIGSRVSAQNVYTLPPLNNSSSLIYCRQSLKGNPSATLVAQICAKAQGHPLYLRYIIEYANSTSGAVALDDFPILAGSIEHYYETIWARLLSDSHAVNLLGIMARLRSAITKEHFLKILTADEQAVFIPTMERIQHLLLNPNVVSIYHPSFGVFLIGKTKPLETVVHERLSSFCTRESHLRYCVQNCVFHGLRSNNTDRSRTVVVCDQHWVDACVKSGVDPDVLLSDIERTMFVALEISSTPEILRLLLLSQRVSFRYDVLLAQSAFLIAHALLVLKRPEQALNHVMRYGTLILEPAETLRLSLEFIRGGYQTEGKVLLEVLETRIIDEYGSENLTAEEFERLCIFHLRSLLFMRLADGNGRMAQVMQIQNNASRVLRANLSKAPKPLLDELLLKIACVPTSYFICFRDSYPSLQLMREFAAEQKTPFLIEKYLFQLVFSLFDCMGSLEEYDVSKGNLSISQLCSDIGEILSSGATLDQALVEPTIDALIQLEAPAHLIVATAKGKISQPVPLVAIKATNGVDVDLTGLYKASTKWRIAGFLDQSIQCPTVGILNQNNWLSTLEEIVRALFFCEGRSRWAKLTQNDLALTNVRNQLDSAVLKPLQFKLADRIKWENAYFVPESVLPFVYRHLAILLMDCFPKDMPQFLKDLSDRSSDQYGVYSEGYREIVHEVLAVLGKYQLPSGLEAGTLQLLRELQKHVLSGVENRHELVPEVLRLIPLFARLGAVEEAERLYETMLDVSMGPTWYKEDQFSLLTSVLAKMPVSDEVAKKLPLIAGYLDRGDGEMTFQRYVRFQKSRLIGQLFRRNRCASGCKYFIRQTAGTTEQLCQEWEKGAIDKPTPRKGMRFPGNSLDEQEAILQIVEHSLDTDWRARWALLTIFQFGDERHIEDYAKQYARLVNVSGETEGSLGEMSYRLETLLHCDMPSEYKERFGRSFQGELDAKFSKDFAWMLVFWSSEKPAGSAGEAAVVKEDGRKENEGVVEEDKDGLYTPGLFGRRSATRQAKEELGFAESELKLGNVTVAKERALKSLRILQDGGWSIWGQGSDSAVRAEELLREGANSADEVIRMYAPLLAEELWSHKWIRVAHIFGKVADLMRPDDRIKVLSYVIEHFRLLVGNPAIETAKFDFLSDNEPLCDPSLELFHFIVWFIDHPQRIRRDRAAAMIAWLVKGSTKYLEAAANYAFSNMDGYRPDVLCGLLDYLSNAQPQILWETIRPPGVLQNVLRDCKHTGRLGVLQRIADRAGDAGIASGLEAAASVTEVFREGAIELQDSRVNCDLPLWANDLTPEWKMLAEIGMATDEIKVEFGKFMTESCKPLSIEDARNLEKALSLGFREPAEVLFNRWNGKLHSALNRALLAYGSKRNFKMIESILRIFNPTVPELTLTPNFESPCEAALLAIESHNDYAKAIGDDESLFLNYHEALAVGTNPNLTYIEVLAVIVPTSRVSRSLFLPTTACFFTSTSQPNYQLPQDEHETCYHLRPQPAFFGSFTPAFVLPSFMRLINATETDFSRINWRRARSKKRGGAPMMEGCLLRVKRGAVRLPSGKKLSWIIRLNGETLTMVDLENNRLF